MSFLDNINQTGTNVFKLYYFVFLADTSTATCERPLTELENGKIEQPDLDRLLNPGEKIWFSCNPNYELIGAAHITCLDDGQWDYNPPKCKRELLKV